MMQHYQKRSKDGLRTFALPVAIIALILTCPVGGAQATDSTDSELDTSFNSGRILQGTIKQNDSTVPANRTLPGCPKGWTKAMGTLYSSWPRPGSQECVVYEGCRWAGQFSAISAEGRGGKCAPGAKKITGGMNSPVECRFTPNTVKNMRMASTTLKDFKRLRGRTLEVFIEGRPNVTTTVTIRDNCNDADCRDDNCGGAYKGCCAKHSDNFKYTLLDLEANPASDLLGVDLTKEDVGGPYQKEKISWWALNIRPGLRECIAGNNTMPLCYRIRK